MDDKISKNATLVALSAFTPEALNQTANILKKTKPVESMSSQFWLRSLAVTSTLICTEALDYFGALKETEKYKSKN